MTVYKRARTADEKREVMGEITPAWVENEYLRLGQLIVNAVGQYLRSLGRPCNDQEVGLTLFYMEDTLLRDVIKDYQSRTTSTS